MKYEFFGLKKRNCERDFKEPFRGALPSINSGRNLWIEALRIISAFGIVWYHAEVFGYEVAYAGLSAFVAIATFFEARRETSRNFEILALARRLLVPWAVWFLVFGLYNLARHKSLLPPLSFTPAAILLGTSQTLWYMPFMFATLLCLRILMRSTFRFAVAPIAAILVLLDLAAIDLWRPWSIWIGAPIAQYAQALPAVLFGIVLAESISRPAYRWGVVLIVAAMAAAAMLPFPGVGLPHAIGCAAVAASVALGSVWPLPTQNIISHNIAKMSELTYGVYLVHPFCLAMMHYAIPLIWRGQDLGPGGVFFAFTAAIVFTWFIRRFGGKLGLAVT